MPVCVHRLGSVLLALALVTAGCSGGDDDREGDAAPAPRYEPPRKAVEGVIVEASEYRFEAPSVLDGGVVTMTLRNEGDKTHALSLVDIGTTPIETWSRDFKAIVTAKGPAPALPAYIATATGVSGRAPTAAQVTQTFTLPPGRYVMYCDLTDADTVADPEEGSPPTTGQRPAPHFELGMTKVVTVRAPGPSAPSELPSDIPTIVARDWGFEVPTIDPAAVTLAARNDGPTELHHAVLLAYPGDVSPDDARRSVVEQTAAQNGRPAPASTVGRPFSVGGSTVFSPGQGGTFDVVLRPGLTYVLACFLPDRAGGLPHVLSHDMITAFRIDR